MPTEVGHCALSRVFVEASRKRSVPAVLRSLFFNQKLAQAQHGFSYLSFGPFLNDSQHFPKGFNSRRTARLRPREPSSIKKLSRYRNAVIGEHAPIALLAAMNVTRVEYYQIAGRELKSGLIADKRAPPFLHKPNHVMPVGMRRKRLHHPTVPPPLPYPRQWDNHAFRRFTSWSVPLF
ncbi:hypothetical protein PZH32_03855 [Adlercreutzia equolifaciens]|nr:hypothetical protein [Adlercreutzia equolifaciens]MDE8702093.1 hypothetical protein [Adlercreutzia equolifaciens]